MKALVFAAGRGERMRPLTDTTPKPLLEVGGRPLIAWHLQQLATIGVRDVVVNISWLAARFREVLGDGSSFGLRLHLLDEGPRPLETGGGLLNALPRLGPDPFVVVNGDVWTDFSFQSLPAAPEGLAHLVLVDNPEHHPEGDFVLGPDGRLLADGTPALTFAGIGVYRPQLLDGWQAPDAAPGQPPCFRLAPLLHAAIARGQVSGQHHQGAWTDVGTPQRLQALRGRLEASRGGGRGACRAGAAPGNEDQSSASS